MQAMLIDIVVDHVSRIYPNENHRELANKLLLTMNAGVNDQATDLHVNKWSEKDAWLITYGDSVISPDETPLKTLKQFIDNYFSDSISGVHILPFFPYSSDEGFSVINYSQVNDSLGDWHDIEAISSDYDVMADLVINHCSQRSRWFENFRQQKHPGKDYFITEDHNKNFDNVVRPRTSPLLRETWTVDGDKYVWCTFSHDQVDLNFKNPDVLIEMLTIIKRYLEQGVKIFRLDAIAFLWKEPESPCIHLPQTHEIVRLIRTLIEAHSPQAIIITETNVPNHENLSYFGNANEAHAVYNFSLPPLLVQALLSGNSDHLKRWQMSMPPAQNGTFYFNFIASHDGIGLRPIKGLLDEDEVDQLINTLQSFGARVSWRSIENGKQEAYEINIALYDALQGTDDGPDKWQRQRFICAHAIMFSLEGIPGIYIHSLLATQNDTQRVNLSNHNRDINRKKWDLQELSSLLENPKTHHNYILDTLKNLLKIRCAQTAFHPNAIQYTLHLGSQIFAFWRQSADRKQSIFCLHNVTNEVVNIPINSINLINLQQWHDLISKQVFSETDEEIILPPYGFVWLSNGEY